MEIVEAFLTRYEREQEYYREGAGLCALQCERGLEQSGVRALVTYRVKRPERVRAKIALKCGRCPDAGLADVEREIGDLCGVRIALYFPGDLQAAGAFVRSQFAVVQEKSAFRSRSDSTYRRVFPGYQAVHYRVRLKEEHLAEEQRHHARTQIEIQVASVLMHAWAEVEHDLVYKPSGGDLSEDEHALLDELNGLVLAGEITLQRLQRALKRRVDQEDRRFNTHYDLAAYLYTQLPTLSPAGEDAPLLGRADLLLLFLQHAQKDTPAALGPVLGGLDLRRRDRTLAELIVQRVAADAPSAADTERLLDEYETQRRSVERRSSLAQLEESVRSRRLGQSAPW